MSMNMNFDPTQFQVNGQPAVTNKPTEYNLGNEQKIRYFTDEKQIDNISHIVKCEMVNLQNYDITVQTVLRFVPLLVSDFRQVNSHKDIAQKKVLELETEIMKLKAKIQELEQEKK